LKRTKDIVPIELVERLREYFLLPMNEVAISDGPTHQRMLFDGKKNKELIDAMVHAANHQINPAVLELSDSATELVNKISKDTWDRTRQLNQSMAIMNEHYLVPILQRKVEMIYKLAVIWSMSQGKLDLVDVGAIEWAEKLFDYSQRNLEFHLGTLLVKRDAGTVIAAITKWVLSQQGTLLRRSDLRRHCERYSGGKNGIKDFNAEFDAIVKTLTQDGVIEVDTSPRRSRNVVYKVLRDQS